MLYPSTSLENWDSVCPSVFWLFSCSLWFLKSSKTGSLILSLRCFSVLGCSSSEHRCFLIKNTGYPLPSSFLALFPLYIVCWAFSVWRLFLLLDQSTRKQKLFLVIRQKICQARSLTLVRARPVPLHIAPSWQAMFSHAIQFHFHSSLSFCSCLKATLYFFSICYHLQRILSCSHLNTLHLESLFCIFNMHES